MKRRGFTLVGTMVVIALILFLAVYLMMGGERGGKSLRKDGLGTTYVGAAKLRANDAECINHLRDMRLALEVWDSSNGDERPTALADLKQPENFSYCPIGKKEPYVFNPAATDPREAIKCVHPGHEKY